MIAPLFAAAFLFLSTSVFAQERTILSSEISVSSGEAALRLELSDNTRLDVTLRGGTITVDGREVGSYRGGDALDRSWRELLGRAITLNGGSLRDLLLDWEPPATAGAAGDAVDRALQNRLSPPPAPATDVPAADTVDGLEGLSRQIDGAVLERLFARTERLRQLTGAIEGLRFNGVRVHVGEPVTITEDEVIPGTLLVIDGDVELYGEVGGNVVILGGTLNLHEGSRVGGDVRWADGRVIGERGAVDGRIRRAQVATPTARAVRADAAPPRADRRRGVFAPLRYILRGIGGLFQNLISLAVMSLIGFLVVHFARDNVEVVARTARRSTMRSAAMGFAGTFLFLPVWIVGMLALTISIIGIPVLLAWIPLFPLAFGLAIVLGYLAVSINLGEWLAAQRFERLPWLRASHAFTALVAGLTLLLLPFMAANVVEMGGPWLRGLRGLLSALGVIAAVVAATIGLGAVILSRGGRNTDFAWIPDAGPDPDLDLDDWVEEASPPPHAGAT
jgi:hypothetical protein